MQGELYKLLRPVRNRLTRSRALPRVAGALMIGGWLALIGALLTLFGGSMTSGLIAVAVALAFPTIALVWSLLHPATWQETAQLVDTQLRLHNRTTTALDLSQQAESDPFAKLQIDDAIARLKQAKLTSIGTPAPWQRIAGGMLLTGFSLALIGWGIIAPPSAAIQTSGDIQDIRPEIAERSAIEIGIVNADAIVTGALLSAAGSDSSNPAPHESQVGARYFERLQAESDL